MPNALKSLTRALTAFGCQPYTQKSSTLSTFPSPVSLRVCPPTIPLDDLQTTGYLADDYEPASLSTLLPIPPLLTLLFAVSLALLLFDTHLVSLPAPTHFSEVGLRELRLAEQYTADLWKRDAVDPPDENVYQRTRFSIPPSKPASAHPPSLTNRTASFSSSMILPPLYLMSIITKSLTA